METRYRKIAWSIAAQIEAGAFVPGNRLPSIREACRLHSASITTIQEAYYLLEAMGLAEPRSRSGYYVLGKKISTVKPKIQKNVQTAAGDRHEEQHGGISRSSISLRT